MARKEDKKRPYRVDYFDINDMDNDLALVRSVVVRAVTADAAIANFVQYPNRVFIRAYRFYKKLVHKKDVYKAVEDLFSANKAVAIMERVEAWRAHPTFADPASTTNDLGNTPAAQADMDAVAEQHDSMTNEGGPVVADHATPDSAYGVQNATFYKNNAGTTVQTPAQISLSKLRNNVPEILGQILVEMLGIDEDEVQPNASFTDDLGADSLDTIELVMAVEEVFDIYIEDEDAEKINTIQEAVYFIQRALDAKLPAPTSGPESPATVAVVADMNSMLSNDAHEQAMDNFVPTSVPDGKHFTTQASVQCPECQKQADALFNHVEFEDGIPAQDFSPRCQECAAAWIERTFKVVEEKPEPACTCDNEQGCAVHDTPVQPEPGLTSFTERCPECEDALIEPGKAVNIGNPFVARPNEPTSLQVKVLLFAGAALIVLGGVIYFLSH